MKVFTFRDAEGDNLGIFGCRGAGIHVTADPAGVIIPDEKIPDMISALQDYMSRRAKEIAGEGIEGRPERIWHTNVKL